MLVLAKILLNTISRSDALTLGTSDVPMLQSSFAAHGTGGDALVRHDLVDMAFPEQLRQTAIKSCIW